MSMEQMDLMEPPVRKQIKLEDSENTMPLCQMATYSDLKQQLSSQKHVSFLSQRQRFTHILSNSQESPLPQVYQVLRDKAKQLDYNLWKRKHLQLTELDVLRVRQLLTLDPTIYKVRVLSQTSIELRFCDSVQENLPMYEPNPQFLPIQLSLRQRSLYNLLLNLAGTNDLHQSAIDVLVPEVEPLRLEGLNPMLSELQRVELQDSVTNIFEIYEKRGVSFMFIEKVKTYIGDDEGMRKLNLLFKLLPHVLKQKDSILQLNRQIDLGAIHQRLQVLST